MSGCFCGDGEMDEPESLGAIGLAAREKLDNLVFVVNCNLQRLDGPVRGNGKIIQELEGEFRGAGWNVIKLIWGSNWDPLLARDKDGALRKIMNDTLDGDYQAFKANDGAFVRKNFFGRSIRALLEMVAKMSDDDIWALRRGGHDAEQGLRRLPRRQRATRGSRRCCSSRRSRAGAWAGAVKARTPRTRPRSSPTTNCATSAIAVQPADPRRTKLAKVPVLQAGRRHAGDEVPARATQGPRRLSAASVRPKAEESLHRAAAGHVQGRARADRRGPRDQHHAGLRALPHAWLLRDKDVGPRVVPILVDEARTFGMEGLFRQIGIYNPRRARSTRRSTRTRSCTTAKPRTARSCRKASTKRAAWRAGSPRRRRTRRTTACR